MLAIESYRPSIISPAPGRYVKVGTDRCLCSCSSLFGARTCSSGRLSCAPQPMSARSTPKKIADLTRIILLPVTGYSVEKATTPVAGLAEPDIPLFSRQARKLGSMNNRYPTLSLHTKSRHPCRGRRLSWMRKFSWITFCRLSLQPSKPLI
jgi:hypothetical protein